MTKDLILQLISFIDLTTLDSRDTKDKVLELVTKANQGVEGVHPAAICVYPTFAETVASGTTLPIAVVAGCFPTGQTFIQAKTEEIKLAAASHASEIDMVINRGKLIEGDKAYLRKEIRACKKAADKKL